MSTGVDLPRKRNHFRRIFNFSYKVAMRIFDLTAGQFVAVEEKYSTTLPTLWDSNLFSVHQCPKPHQNWKDF